MFRFGFLASLVIALLAAMSMAVVACGDDDDDDDDDAAVDDDAADDDGADDDDGDDDACESTEESLCTHIVEMCGDPLGMGSVDDCTAMYQEDCESGSIGDGAGFISCVCECEAADPDCADPDAFGSCEGDCFGTFCGTI